MPSPLIVRRYSYFFTVICFCIGMLVLVGWQWNIEHFMRPIPGLAVMNPTTAVCFLMMTLALFLSHQYDDRQNWSVYSLAIACFFIGMLRLLGQALHWKFQIDQLLYDRQLVTEFSNGHMAPSVAISLILGSLAIMAMSIEKFGKYMVQILGGMISLIAWFSVLGYMYRVPEFYGEIAYLPMAVHTSIGFLLFSFALLTRYPDHALMKHIFSTHQGSAMGRFLLPAIFIVPVVFGYVRLWSHWENLVSVEFGVALLMVSLTLVFAILVFIMIRLLNKRDIERDVHEKSLLFLNNDLLEKNDEIHALNEEFQASNEELVASNEELNALNDQLSIASDKIREQSEIILKQKEEQLNRVLDSSQDVIWSIDLTGEGETYISRSVENIFGEQVSEAMLKNLDFWMERTHPEDRKRKQEARDRLATTGRSECDYRLRMADNNYCWIYERSRLVYDATNKPVRHEGIVTDLTAYKKQEEVLSQFQENLNIIFNNTVEEILLLDREGKVMLFNRALEKFLTQVRGNKPEAGMYVWDITSSERKATSQQLFFRALQGETITVEAPIQTPEGEVIHELRYEPVFIEGHVKFVTVISVDITERKKREILIQQSEANLRSIFDNTKDAFTLLDKEYRVVAFNGTALGISGGGLAPGVSIFDTMETDGKEIFLEYLDRVFQGETVDYNVQSGEKENLTWFRIVISAVRADGVLLGYCITCHDYTIVKRVESFLKESEERFRALVENSEDIIALSNKDGNIVYLNPRVKQITGYDSDEFLSIKSEDHIHPDDVDHFRAFFNAVFKNPEKLYRSTYRMRHKDGTWRWLEGTAINLLNSESITGIVTNFRDITQRRESEEEKTTLMTQLIEKNNDLLQFSFIASHNLRGPVASILGLFNILKPVEKSTDMANILSMADKSIVRLDEVIHDLSVILDMRSSELQAKEQVSLFDLALKVREELRTEIEKANAEIVVEVEEAPSFYTVKSYLHSIVYNLVSNAIKYRSEKNNLKIKISSFKTERTVGFMVKDNGEGIDLNRFGEKLFMLYQRFNQQIDGKGVGLYMVKNQVQLLGGRIDVKSIQGKGSVFTVSFPME